MGRRAMLLWVTVALALMLVLPELAAAVEPSKDDPESAAVSGSKEEHENVEEDDEWEEIEDDDEVSLAAASSRSANRAVKALPRVTDQNADRILRSTEHVLLMGYAPWCKESAKVMIDFAEAATVLAAQGSAAVLAKVDATANKATANRYNIQGYPTIIFLTNGSEEIYTAGQTRDDFVYWVRKKTGRPATTFMTKAEAKELQSRDATVVIGLFEKFEGSDYEDFIASSKEVVDIKFLQTTNADTAKVFNADFDETAPAIAIWKRGDLKCEEIVPLVCLNKFALVTKLHSGHLQKVYKSPVNKQVILFANSYDYDSIYPVYLAAAKYFKGQLFFVWVDIEDEDFVKPMTNMYGIQGSEPAVAGFDNSNGSKYLLDAEVTKQSLKNKGDVKVVAGRTLEKLVLRSSKDVLLLVSTSYCHGCDSVAKSFTKLAKHYKDLPGIVFAKVDASNNEHPVLKVQNFPALLLYHASSKDSPPVEASTKPSFKKLVQFVEENHLGLHPTAKEDTDSEAKLSETESISTLPDVEVQTPEDTLGTGAPESSLEQKEPEDLESSPQTQTETCDGSCEGGGHDVELLQAIDITSEPSVAALEVPRPTNTEHQRDEL